MDTWTEVARAETAAGDAIVLRRRGDVFDIRFNGWELMSSRNAVSEMALARIVCEHVHSAAPRILIGGLGMGFTLRAALDAVGIGASVIVCELLKEIVAWNEGALGPLAGQPLKDERVTVIAQDVMGVLDESEESFDAMLFDTDNGPDNVIRPPNEILYTEEGLARISRALSPGGVAGFWSASESRDFEHALDGADWSWRRVRIFLRSPNQEPFHVIYLAGQPLMEKL